MTIVETTPAMEVTSVIAPHTITDDDLERVFIEGEAADRFDNLVTTIAYLGQYQLAAAQEEEWNQIADFAHNSAIEPAQVAAKKARLAAFASLPVKFLPIAESNDTYSRQARYFNGHPDQVEAAIADRLARIPEENREVGELLGDLATRVLGKPKGFGDAPVILEAFDALAGVDQAVGQDQLTFDFA
jgi:hypothetical protein